MSFEILECVTSCGCGEKTCTVRTTIAIAKAQEAIYNERQQQSESNIDYLQSFKNKAVVLEAAGGNLVNVGVSRYMSEKLYNKEYAKCTLIEKVDCNKKGREAMMATVYMMKADKQRYSKLLTDLHDDHFLID